MTAMSDFSFAGKSGNATHDTSPMTREGFKTARFSQKVAIGVRISENEIESGMEHFGDL
jgi:hypothetical protein